MIQRPANFKFPCQWAPASCVVANPMVIDTCTMQVYLALSKGVHAPRKISRHPVVNHDPPGYRETTRHHHHSHSLREIIGS